MSVPLAVGRNAKLEAGDLHHEVTLAWHCYQKLRVVYHARPEQSRPRLPELHQLPASLPADRRRDRPYRTTQ